jgi:hypothetical protein
MSHHILVFNVRFDLMPDFIECRGIFSMPGGNPMNRRKPTPVIIIWRLDQQADFVGNDPVFHPDYSNLADAPPVTLGSFEIDGCERYHDGVNL